MEQDPQPGLGTDAMGDLVAQHRAELITIAQAIVRDRNEAEDVVQDAILGTLRRLPNIAPHKLSHYLSRAVRQNALKRASRRRLHAALDPTTPDRGIENVDSIGPIDPIDLEQAIASLALTQQSVVRMKYFLGMTFRQIGISLSISTHTAASRCRYALEKLKRMLDD